MTSADFSISHKIQRTIETLDLLSCSTPKEEPYLLQGDARDRFFHFFSHRTYQYEALLEIGSDKIRLAFDLPLIQFLRHFGNKLQKPMAVRGFFLKGGAVDPILSGKVVSLSDLDLTLEIDGIRGRDDFDLLEKIFLESLEDFSQIYLCSTVTNPQSPNSFIRTYMQKDKKFFSEMIPDKSCPPRQFCLLEGARSNRKIVWENDNCFAIHSLPTYFNGALQKIDIQLCYKAAHSCVSSWDSFQIDITSLIHRKSLSDKELDVSLRSVDGYDVRKSLELKERQLFDIEPRSNIQEIREGLRVYCRTVSRGGLPVSMEIERLFLERFIREREANPQRSAMRSLHSYLEGHYLDHPQGKIVYLLNYYGIFDRGQRNEMSEVVLQCLSAALEMPVSSEENISALLDACCLFLFFRACSSKDHHGNAFFLVDQGKREKEMEPNYLLISSSLLKRVDDSLLSHPLLQKLAELFSYDSKDLFSLFQHKMQKEISPFIMLWQEEKFEEILSYKKAKEDRLTDRDKKKLDPLVQSKIVDLFNNKQIDLGVKLVHWTLQNDLFAPAAQQFFLQDIFHRLCCEGSIKKAIGLLNKLGSSGESIAPFLSYFIPENMKDMQSLIGALALSQEKKAFNAEECYEPFLSLFASSLSAYPALMGALINIARKEPAALRARLLSDVTKQLPPKIVFPLFKALYEELDSPLDAAMIHALLAEFFRVDPSAALQFYAKAEADLLSSDLYLPIYLQFLHSAASMKDERMEALIVHGLIKMEEKKEADPIALEILKVFHHRRELFLKRAPVAKQLAICVQQGDAMEIKSLRKALNGPVAETKKDTPRPPNHREVAMRLAQEISTGKMFEAEELVRFFEIGDELSGERLYAMNQQVALVYENFLLLKEEEIHQGIYFGYVQFFIAFVSLKQERIGHRDEKTNLVQLENCLKFFNSGLEQGFFSFHHQPTILLYRKILQLLQMSSEGMNILFHHLDEIEGRQGFFSKAIAELRCTLIDMQFYAACQARDIASVIMLCGNIEKFSLSLAKHNPESCVALWHKIFNQVGAAFNQLSCIIELDHSGEGQRRLYDLFSSVVEKSRLAQHSFLLFSPGYFRAFLREAQENESLRELCDKIMPQLWTSMINPQLISHGSVNELLEASERAVKDEICIAYLQRAIQLEPENALVACRLGGMLVAAEKSSEAEVLYQRVLSREPQHYGALAGLGAVYQAQEKWTEAHSKYRQAMSMHPEPEPFILQCLSLVCLHLKQLDQAMEYIEQALVLDQENVSCLIHKANCYYHQGKTTEARRLLEHLHYHFPGNIKVTQLLREIYLNTIQLFIGNNVARPFISALWQKVKDICYRPHDLTLDAHENWVVYGTACANLELWDEAYDALLRAYMLNPNNPACLIPLADCLFERKEIDQAVRRISEAIQLAKESPKKEEVLKEHTLAHMIISRAYYCLSQPTTPKRVEIAREDIKEVFSRPCSLWEGSARASIVQRKWHLMKKKK